MIKEIPFVHHTRTDIGYGEVRAASAALIEPDLGPLLLTGIEPAGDGIALTLLNPEDKAVTATVRPGTFRPRG